jgi:hypothetical protein
MLRTRHQEERMMLGVWEGHSRAVWLLEMPPRKEHPNF